MSLRTVSKIAVVIAIAMGLGMMAMGVAFIVLGAEAKSDIRAALRQEEVITSADASIPGVPVEDVQTARAQAEAIEAHTFGRFGPYSSMQRDDPNRQVYLNGLTLRNSLNLTIVGFGVGDLAIGMGAVTVVLGLIIAALAVPVHVLVMRVTGER
ncbi:MAG: hypothetical protein FJ320_08420 [SAR202 cluster bacterium]|nr:hypothetical protein [SAR202 cluster bacterium]